jgi:hypothetical protein
MKLFISKSASASSCAAARKRVPFVGIARGHELRSFHENDQPQTVLTVDFVLAHSIGSL